VKTHTDVQVRLDWQAYAEANDVDVENALEHFLESLDVFGGVEVAVVWTENDEER